jgi:uncharacterized protein with HEPN domain
VKEEREEIDFINDIIESIKNAIDFTSAMKFEEFNRDVKTQLAVTRLFEIIGEAAKHIPSEIKRKFPEIQWKKMTAMRNMMIHEYFGINNEIIWKTVKEIFPGLKVQIEGVRSILDKK